jgi:autotransporter translocation and assembly factor TamB
MEKVKVIKRSLIGLTLTVLTLSTIIVGAVGYVFYTESGRSYLTPILTRILSAGIGYPVKLRVVEGDLHTNITIASVDVLDQDGVWLTAQNISLKWGASKLLDGIIHIQKASLETIDLQRTPVGESKPLTLKDLDSLYAPLIVEDLTIKKIMLSPAIAGGKQMLTFVGSLNVFSKTANLSLTSLDKSQTLFSFSATPLKEGGVHVESNGQYRGDKAFKLEAQLAGSLKKPEANATLTLSSNVDLPNQNGSHAIFPVSLKTHATIINGTLTLKGDLQTEGKNAGGININAPWSIIPYGTKTTTLSGTIDTDLDIGILVGLLRDDQHIVRGILKSKLHLSGTNKKPDIQGNITLTNGHYENTLTGTLLDKISLALQAQGNTLTITKATATDGKKGQVTAAGELSWQDDVPTTNMRITAKEAHILNRENASGVVDGTLNIKGSTKNIHITGALDLGPLDIFLPEEFADDIPEIEVVEINQPTKMKKQVILASNTPINLDITIRAPGRVFLRGQGLEAELEGNVHVRGTSDKPIFEGALKTVRGRYVFLSKIFAIKKGEVRIQDEELYINIQGETKTNDITAIITLTGQPDDLDIGISSSPGLPKDEVISRILFGKNTKSISPFQAVQLANTLQKLSGTKSNINLDVIGTVRDTLGVDNISVNSSDDESDEMSVGVGKYLSDGVYLEVEQGTAEQGSKAKIEVEVTPNFSVESNTGTGANTGGVKFNWKHDY